MKLAIAIYRYRPTGGLENDFLNFLTTAVQAKHHVTILAAEWQGAQPNNATLVLIPNHCQQSHNKVKHFSDACQKYFQQSHFDATVGFTKIAGLDYYFAGDPCFIHYQLTQKPWWKRLTHRFRGFAALEESVFHATTHTKIALISPHEKTIFQRYYQTPDHRFLLLPPPMDPLLQHTIEPKAKLSANQTSLQLLFVATQHWLKGLDRILIALSALPESQQKKITFTVVGADKKSIAHRYQNTHFTLRPLGMRTDVPNLMSQADLLVHPARLEAGGKVLIEALLTHLPVITSELCGYAYVIQQANAGYVYEEPFNQQHFNQLLAKLLNAATLEQYRKNAADYSVDTQVFQAYAKLLGWVEQFHHEKQTEYAQE